MKTASIVPLLLTSLPTSLACLLFSLAELTDSWSHLLVSYLFELLNFTFQNKDIILVSWSFAFDSISISAVTMTHTIETVRFKLDRPKTKKTLLIWMSLNECLPSPHPKKERKRNNLSLSPLFTANTYQWAKQGKAGPGRIRHCLIAGCNTISALVFCPKV